ncbi:L-seryl-tRNA(Sec) selenium transferase [Roseococcus sp. MDT2-1-1]|uniref:L-seryl-tRNA(Sec) selenium transferase n=2 Tax=Sabulicella glaciei TaxID=2984948 RepID=A0ABT3NT89_9PROT|nr:L-seryl-tRNA(Sec) selenium transferase [Roseococcus sp. MDT2-1-1]
MDALVPDPRRALPALHRLLAMPECGALVRVHGRERAAAAMRQQLAALREGSEGFDAGEFFAAVEQCLGTRAGLGRVLNATGVVLHTNLGRAPLAAAAIAAMAEVARGYCALEMDLQSGRRGDRFSGAAALLCELTGCEAALVVNNGAAAVLLALSAVAAGGEAIVSRGELVEIGGGFRIPEVVAQGGARLVEVGTTNRTRLSDYERAIGAESRVLLRVHPSNYRILGFTEAPDPARLATLARERGLASVEDLGSGALLDLARLGLPGERGLREAVADGFDLVAASGDKLLGGPQAGLLLGREDAIARCARHPLMRALRPDKATLAALEATLRLHRDPELALREVPALRMMAEDAEALSRRAQSLRALLPETARAEVAKGDSLVGGGALPLARLRTTLVALHPDGLTAEEFAARLRRSHPPLIARLERGRVLLDPRTLAEDEIAEAARAVTEALA